MNTINIGVKVDTSQSTEALVPLEKALINSSKNISKVTSTTIKQSSNDIKDLNESTNNLNKSTDTLSKSTSKYNSNLSVNNSNIRASITETSKLNDNMVHTTKIYTSNDMTTSLDNINKLKKSVSLVSNELISSTNKTVNFFDQFTIGVNNVVKKMDYISKPFRDIENATKRLLGVFIGRDLADQLFNAAKLSLILILLRQFNVALKAIKTISLDILKVLGSTAVSFFSSIGETAGKLFGEKFGKALASSTIKLIKMSIIAIQNLFKSINIDNMIFNKFTKVMTKITGKEFTAMAPFFSNAQNFNQILKHTDQYSKLVIKISDSMKSLQNLSTGLFGTKDENELKNLKKLILLMEEAQQLKAKDSGTKADEIKLKNINDEINKLSKKLNLNDKNAEQLREEYKLRKILDHPYQKEISNLKEILELNKKQEELSKKFNKNIEEQRELNFLNEKIKLLKEELKIEGKSINEINARLKDREKVVEKESNISFKSTKKKTFTDKMFSGIGKKTAEEIKDFMVKNPEIEALVEFSKVVMQQLGGVFGKFNILLDLSKKAAGPLGNVLLGVLKTINKIPGGLATITISLTAIVVAAKASIQIFKKLSDKFVEIVDIGGRIDDLSQRMGLTTNSFQKMEYMAIRAGTTVEDFANSAKRLTVNAFDAAKGNKELSAYFDVLGISIKNSNGTMKDQETLLHDTLKAISKLPESTERQVIAQKLLGKSADSLAPLFNEGADAVDKYFESSKYAVLMSKELTLASSDIGDIMTDLKNRTKTAIYAGFEPLVIEIRNLLKLFIESSYDGDILKNTFISIGKAIASTIHNVYLFGTFIKDLVQSKVTQVILGLAGAFGVFKGIVALTTLQIKGLNLTLLANPFTALALTLTSVIALIYKFNDNIDKALNKQAEFMNASVGNIDVAINKLKEVNRLDIDNKTRKNLIKDLKELTGQTVKWDASLQQYVLTAGASITSIKTLEVHKKASEIREEKARKAEIEDKKKISDVTNLLNTNNNKSNDISKKLTEQEINRIREKNKYINENINTYNNLITTLKTTATLNKTLKSDNLGILGNTDFGVEPITLRPKPKIKLSFTKGSEEILVALKNDIQKTFDILQNEISQKSITLGLKVNYNIKTDKVDITKNIYNSIKEQFNAQKEMLNLEKNTELAQLNSSYNERINTENLTNKQLLELRKNYLEQKALIEEDYNNRNVELNNQHIQKSFEQINQLATNSFDIFSSIGQLSVAKRQKEISNIEKDNIKKLENFKGTEKQKQKFQDKLEADLEAKREEIKKKEKAWQIAQVGIDTAAAIGQMWMGVIADGAKAGIPGVLTASTFASIMTGIMTAKSIAQIAMIAKYKDGGIIGGIKGATMGKDNTVINARKGEMILNAKQQRYLFNAINNRSIGNGNISVYRGDIIIQGNVTEDTLDSIREVDDDFLYKFKNAFDTLRGANELSFA